MSAIGLIRRRTPSGILVTVAVLLGLVAMHSVVTVPAEATGSRDQVQATSTLYSSLPSGVPVQQCFEACQTVCQRGDAACAAGIAPATFQLVAIAIDSPLEASTGPMQLIVLASARVSRTRPPSLIALSISRT